MSRTLKPINAQKVNTQLDRALSMTNRRTLVQHRDARSLELANHGAGRVSGRLDNLDALVDDGLGVGRVVGREEGREEGQVDAERLVGEGAAALDLGAQGFGRGGDEGGDDAQAAAVGDCGREVCGADVHEAALDDGDWMTRERLLADEGNSSSNRRGAYRECPGGG